MRTHLTNIIISLVVAVVAIFAYMQFFANPAPDTGPEQTRLVLSLPISGFAEIDAKPDRATATLGVTTDAETAASAVSQNSAAMEEVFARLRAFGIADENLLTQNFHVRAVYTTTTTEDVIESVFTGYRVRNEIRVTFENLENVGPALDAAFQSGSNSLIGIYFWVSERYAIQSHARTLAIADARAQAQLIADAAGLELGYLVGMNVGAGNSTATQQRGRFDDDDEESFVVTASRIARSEVASNAPATQVSGGSQKISATVTMTYQLLGPWRDE